MTSPSLTREFAQRVHLPLACVEDGLARSVALEKDLTLEFVWLAEVPALCLAIPVGQMRGVSRAEGLAGLPASALASSQALGAAGAPHYAVSAGQNTLYLCQTLLGDAPAAPALQPVLDGMAQMARQARERLHSNQAVD